MHLGKIFVKGFLGPQSCYSTLALEWKHISSWSALSKDRNANWVQTTKCGTEVMFMWLCDILVYLVKDLGYWQNVYIF
jgi:hypothetical protein